MTGATTSTYTPPLERLIAEAKNGARMLRAKGCEADADCLEEAIRNFEDSMASVSVVALTDDLGELLDRIKPGPFVFITKPDKDTPA